MIKIKEIEIIIIWIKKGKKVINIWLTIRVKYGIGYMIYHSLKIFPFFSIFPIE